MGNCYNCKKIVTVEDDIVIGWRPCNERHCQLFCSYECWEIQWDIEHEPFDLFPRIMKEVK